MMIINIYNYFRKLYYRRLYKNLVFTFLKHESTCILAYEYANTNFYYITGHYYKEFIE